MGVLLKRALLWVACAGVLAVPAPGEAAGGGSKSVNTLITDYYQSILGRAPDPGGFAYWSSQAELIQTLGGDVTETWRALAITFFESPEYQAGSPSDTAYLGNLYDAFFQRNPDAGGLAYWQQQLQAGMPRETVLLWFVFSPEFDAYMTGLFGDTHARAESQMVVDFYRGFLNRMPDDAGFAYWVGRFRSAQCVGRQAVLSEVEAISQQFLGSAEYAGRGRSSAGFVSDLYNAFLRRGADLDGLNHWKARAAAGVDPDEMRRGFMASAEFQARVDAIVRQGCPTLAAASLLTPVVVDQSVSPFVAVIELRGLHADRIASVDFTVQPKAGAASRPVHASYSAQYLAAAGYGPAASYGYRVPVFGLYQAYGNQVQVQATFTDGSSAQLEAAIVTATFVDPTGIYANPTILKRRDPGTALAFDYFYIRSFIATPIVIDSDGEVRWWIPHDVINGSALYEDNGFTIAADRGMSMRRVELDGRFTDIAIAADHYSIHHNIDPGRTGLLLEVNTGPDGVDIENMLIEVAPDGSLIKEWSFAGLISAHMAARGDDPSQFVELGRDWFHMNAVAYDPRDDSIIASSRENFLIKARWSTGELLWILGDPTKYWHTFPSLRELAIELEAPGFHPIGQHAVSVLPNGDVMVFNNGMWSLNNPPGTASGVSRTHSVVSTYAINPITMTARETRRFDYDQSILSQFCSSAYPVGDSILVGYALASNGSRSRMVGVGGDNRVVFDLEYVNTAGCNTGYNAAPVPFEAMVF